MINLSVRRTHLNPHIFKKTLQRLLSTAATLVESAPKESSDQYEKELKKYETLTNIVKRTRQKKPQREPFVKNLLIGKYDKEILTFPELDLEEVKNTENQVEKLRKVLQQRHMININSIGNKNFRQNLSDFRAIGLQASQFLDGRECCPLELMRFLEALSEHQLRDNLLHNELLGVEALNKFADDNLKKKYLYPVIKGEQVSAFAMNEDRLLDLTKMKTEVVLSADKKFWTLNGTKTFVVNGISADFYIVFATAEKVKLGTDVDFTLGAFVVEKDTPGVSWRKLESAGLEAAEITFDNVKVPAENQIGKIYETEEALKTIIQDFRLSCGPACIALSRRMINNTFKSLVEVTTDDYELLTTDAVRSILGEMAVELYVAESVTYLTAGLQDWYKDQDVDIESSIVKVLSSESAYKISTWCLELVGLPATSKDHWARRTHDEVLNYLTLHETNDSQRMFIAMKGLQHAGVNLAGVIKRMRNPFFNSTYMVKRLITERRQHSDKPKLDLELYTHLHPSCTEASKQLEYCVKRLQYVTERLLIAHGLECANKHVSLRQVANIMIDCYAMTAVLARSSRSYCIGLQDAEFEIVLASTFCNKASERVKYNIKGMLHTEYKSDERNHIAFGKKFIERKGWFLTSPISRFF